MEILLNNNYKCSVSTVLNRDVKIYGKQLMFDNKEDTSWSSDEGLPQWIQLRFEEPQMLNAFSFQFQGGFAGRNSMIIVESNEGELLHSEHFYPEDVNAVQHFKLQKPMTEKTVSRVRFLFNSTTDFFGRIIVYKLTLYG